MRGWEPIGASIEREKYRSGGSLSLFQSCHLREVLLGGIVLDLLSTWEANEIEEGATVSLQFEPPFHGTLKGHTDAVRSLASLGDKRFASGSRDETIKIWNTDS